MARDGFFTGLDIGTSSIKVLVAEHVNGEMNVIGVSNAKSAGVKDGIIVDIEAASNAIKTAISQAEEKAGISSQCWVACKLTTNRSDSRNDSSHK